MLVRVTEVEGPRCAEELVERHGEPDRQDVREPSVGALVHGGKQIAVVVDRLAALRAVDGAHVALLRADESRDRRDRRVADVEAERAAAIAEAERPGDLRERVEVEARVREAGRRRIEEAARAHGEDPVERIEVVRAADANAEGVLVAVHDQRIDVLERAEHGDTDAWSVALRRTPGLVRRVELEVVELEVPVHRDVARSGAHVQGQPRRQKRLSGRDLDGEALRRLRRERALGLERDRRAHGETERDVRARPHERAERPAERGTAGRECVARVTRLVLDARHALTGVRIGHGGLIELRENEVRRKAQVEPGRHAVRRRGGRVEDHRSRLDEVVARRGRRVADGERERAIADHRRAESSDGDGQAIEAREVRRQSHEGREERPRRVRHDRKGLLPPRRRRIVGVVREGARALELERVEEEVTAAVDARAALPREPGGVEVDRRTVVGLGDERAASSDGLCAVVRDLETASERGAGSAEDPRRDAHDGRRSDEAPHA